MTTLNVIPGLVLTGAMFEVAADGIDRYVPDLAPLSFERFTDPAGWWMIPDEDGNGYKAELQLLNTTQRTIRLNRWFLPDLRGGQESRPHSHPWHFAARVLAGGYTEDRFERIGAGNGDQPTVREQLGIEHQAGGVNEVPRSVYHEVTQIHDPSATLSLMICGRGQRGQWGYLNTTTGVHTPTAPAPDFAAKLRHLNPHQY
jgi:hypothetical protein